MNLSHPTDTLVNMDEHPWTGLSARDLATDYPMTSQCATLGHPVPKAWEPIPSDADHCICGKFYQHFDGFEWVKRRDYDQSVYR